MNNYKDILKSKNIFFIIIVVAGFGLLAGLVIHQERVQAERGSIALIKQQQNQQDVEHVKNAIKDFNIDSETIIDDWKKIQELKPATDEGKKTLADFLTSTANKVANHYSEKALKLDIKDSDSQFQDKQKLEAAITSLQKILGIITNINSANGRTSIEEKVRPIQELISKFQKQVETLTKKEEQKVNQTETTTSIEGIEVHSPEESRYTVSNGGRDYSYAPAAEQHSSDSASGGVDHVVNTPDQATDSPGVQGETNNHSD